MASQIAVVGRVLELWRYPIASLGGERIEAAEITPSGFVGDRAWAVVDRQNGDIGMAARGARWRPLVQATARYLAEVCGDAELPAVEIRFPDGALATGGERQADDRLSRLLGRTVALRPTLRAPSVARGRVATAYAFTPLHLLTTASLDHLQGLYPQGRSDVRRFRPNILIETRHCRGFVDGDWVGRRARIGEVVLAISEPCKRCAMTTNAQGDLPRDPGILQTVTRENKANMGVYAEVVRAGRITCGDEVALL